MVWWVRLLLLGWVGAVLPSPVPQVDVDTPSPPVILEDGEEQYLDYQYDSLIEQELKDIHTKLFASKDSNTTATTATAATFRHNLTNLVDLISENPDFEFEPVGVEITAVVSHSPRQDDDEKILEQNLELELNPELSSPTELTEKLEELNPIQERLEPLLLRLSWWQILLLVLASLLLTSLCCYFSGCCFLTVDCCSDQYWGCCPCCRSCVRILKPPPHGGSRKQKDRKAPSSYSLNENHTAPRSSIDRSSVSGVPRTERGSTRSVNRSNIGAELKMVGATGTGESPPKPERTSRASRASVESVRNVSTVYSAQEDSLPSTDSAKSIRNYRRSSRTNSFHDSSNPPGRRESVDEPSRILGRSESFQASTRGLDLLAENEKNGRPTGRNRPAAANGEPAPSWVYEDSSGYFSWITKLGGKKKRYKVYSNKNQNSSQKHKYRETKYHHIAESRNSAVIPVKISKRASTASNYTVRPIKYRSRSVESVDSEEDCVQPILHTKSERHLPSRLSTNLADLEKNGRTRRLSGGSTLVVSSPTSPTVHAVPAPGEEYNLKSFEKSLLSSKETTL